MNKYIYKNKDNFELYYSNKDIIQKIHNNIIKSLKYIKKHETNKT